MAVEYKIAALKIQISALNEGLKSIVDPRKKAELRAQIERNRDELAALERVNLFRQKQAQK